MKAHSILIVLAVCMLSFVWLTFGLQIFVYRIPAMTTVKTVGLDVYEDANLTVLLTSIDWGIVDPGENKSVQIYVLSTSNAPIILSLFSENWVPQNATTWVSLSWNYDGSLLQPNASIPLVLTLSLSENVTDIESFSFDIVIMGEG